MEKKLFIRCKFCGHTEEVTPKLFAKIIGGAVAGFGYWAWVTFLFAGTGFALPLCIAIMAGGVAMIAYAEKIVEWINKSYACPKCSHKLWETVTYEEILKDEKLKEKEETIKNKDEKLKEREETIKNKDEKLKEKEETIKKKEEELKEKDEKIKEKDTVIENFLNSFDSLIQTMEANASNDRLDVDQLREAFHTGIKEAKSELDIFVPKLGKQVFGENEFKKELSEALNRGCMVKIRCGFMDPNDTDSRKKLEGIIDRFISDTRFKKYYENGMLRFKIDDSHAKLFIVDEDFYLLSSMNFLSNPGTDMEYSGEVRQKWGELGERSNNVNNLLAYRGKYFSF